MITKNNASKCYEDCCDQGHKEQRVNLGKGTSTRVCYKPKNEECPMIEHRKCPTRPHHAVTYGGVPYVLNESCRVERAVEHVAMPALEGGCMRKDRERERERERERVNELSMDSHDTYQR